MRIQSFRFTAVASLLAALALPANAQDPVCPEILSLVQQGVPGEVGDPILMGQLLSPPVGPQFVDRFVQQVFSTALPSVGSQLTPRTTDCRKDGRGRPIGCRVENQQLGELLEFDSSNGKVAYLNRNREYRGGDNAISKPDALATVSDVMAAFGVPAVELGSSDVQDLMIAAGSPGQPLDLILRAEVHVRFARRLAGTPVFDSGAWGVVGVNGEVARLRIQWPRFELIQGLAAVQTIGRDQVVQMAAEELSQGALCDSYSSVVGIIAYVRASQALGSDRNDEGPATPQGGEGFVPALVVYASPVEVPEDSGQYATAGRQIIVRLLDANGDDA